ncbi:MAG: VIT1/CCC1 transporter family protein [Candidatus Aenigmarchaeota archaeon]|nr:VIT1/CCC1 transporter family protein [Candidatus Aenigmarchaeota archaeon]
MTEQSLKAETRNGKLLRETILGGQDGLVNVLGVVLGVAAATTEQRIIIVSGLAATFAESISMGAVAYTSTKAAHDFYKSMLQREEQEIEKVPRLEKDEIRTIFAKKGFKGKMLSDIVKRITSDKKIWLETMMAEELRLFPDEYEHPLKSGIVVGLSSVVGSFIPLLPFFFVTGIPAMGVAVVISSLFLFVGGSIKAKLTIGDWQRSGTEMLLIGMTAALVGFAIGKMLGISS